MMQKQNSNKRTKGTQGEDFALHILEQNGYSLLCRNYTCPGSEIDLIVTKEDYICFVEVKLRSVLSGINAAHAVDRNKLSRIKKGVEHFFEEYKDNMYVTSLKARIDVFEIYTTGNTIIKHNHITGIS